MGIEKGKRKVKIIKHLAFGIAKEYNEIVQIAVHFYRMM